ncbi:MAG: hypothetical protein AB1714_06765 [Acidobacteriota bacterium]
MVEISTRELKANLAKYLKLVMRGRRVRVLNHGHAVADIVPSSKTTPTVRFYAVTNGVVEESTIHSTEVDWHNVLLIQAVSETEALKIERDFGEGKIRPAERYCRRCLTTHRFLTRQAQPTTSSIQMVGGTRITLSNKRFQLPDPVTPRGDGPTAARMIVEGRSR